VTNLRRWYPHRKARHTLKAQVIRGQEVQAFSIHYGDNKRVIDHQAMLLSKRPTGVEVAVGEGEGVHPGLAQVAAVRSTAHGRPLLAYETVKAFRLGGVTLALNRIAVRTLLTEKPRRINSFVTGASGLTILATYRFPECGGAALLSERVAVHIHPLLLRGVLATAERVQRTTLARLKARRREAR
jgi:hypothetical protein